MGEEGAQATQKISYWEVFMDDIYLLFFLSAAIFFGFYTVWGLMELATAGTSPAVRVASSGGGGGDAAAAPAAVKNVEKNYWADWAKGKAQGPMPDCNVNVLALGGDDILQATVDLYCGVKPGSYYSRINPKVMDIYKARGDTYPDGRTGVLVFETIGAFFSTDHKDGKPIYDVKAIATDQSIASSEPGHPLNPKTCEKCHEEFDQVCVGFVCGNRF